MEKRHNLQICEALDGMLITCGHTVKKFVPDYGIDFSDFDGVHCDIEVNLPNEDFGSLVTHEVCCDMRDTVEGEPVECWLVL